PHRGSRCGAVPRQGRRPEPRRQLPERGALASRARPRTAPSLPASCVLMSMNRETRMNTRLVTVAAACLTLPLLATAQAPELRGPSFPDLKDRATESVDITLGWMPLHLMGWFMSDSDPDTVQVRETIKGLKSVQIRSYQFDADYAYPQADVERLRAQLTA